MILTPEKMENRKKKITKNIFNENDSLHLTLILRVFWLGLYEMFLATIFRSMNLHSFYFP